jgi:hypothetical protein
MVKIGIARATKISKFVLDDCAGLSGPDHSDIYHKQFQASDCDLARPPIVV